MKRRMCKTWSLESSGHAPWGEYRSHFDACVPVESIVQRPIQDKQSTDYKVEKQFRFFVCVCVRVGCSTAITIVAFNLMRFTSDARRRDLRLMVKGLVAGIRTSAENGWYWYEHTSLLVQYIHIWIHMYIYIFMYTHICVYIYIYIYIHLYLHTDTWATWCLRFGKGFETIRNGKFVARINILNCNMYPQLFLEARLCKVFQETQWLRYEFPGYSHVLLYYQHTCGSLWLVIFLNVWWCMIFCYIAYIVIHIHELRWFIWVMHSRKNDLSGLRLQIARSSWCHESKHWEYDESSPQFTWLSSHTMEPQKIIPTLRSETVI